LKVGNSLILNKKKSSILLDHSNLELLYPTLDEPAPSLKPPDASLGDLEVLVWVIIATIQFKIPSQKSI
jgi:hypothetical protein